jgi:hypothetical protein
MGNNNISQRVGFDTERALAATSFNGTFQFVGSALTENPVVIVFDNQSDVSVPLSVDGVNTWKTFSAGEAFVLDLRANHGMASTYTIDLGTRFSTNAAVGTTGSFRISINFAR